MPSPAADRRRHQRYPLPGSLRFHHEPTQRQFPARTVDASLGGALMYVPMSTPLQPGQRLALSVGKTERPELAEISQRPLWATIVRVDRSKLLSLGQLAVGVRFEPPPADAPNS